MSTPKEILLKFWGHNDFRPLQEDIIRSVLDNHDTLALLPTGGGKSICFQIPAMIKEGICIVISPLIALMKDQVENLVKRNIRAVAIYSGMNRREIDITLDNCVHGNVKFLYVSPERLKTEIFIERVKKMNVNLLVVDEAHCISQWGYDFRPQYLNIANIRDILHTKVPVIALTATATKTVSDDIIDKLVFTNPKVYQKSFARENLSYSVFQVEDKETKLLEILRNVKGSGVIYTRTRKAAKEITKILLNNNINADFYHAGLSRERRASRQEKWLANKIRVIVATNAFGMGIDKPDVRFVVHMDPPANPEAYYQEAGRAGRDGKKAYAVVLYHAHDIHLLKEMFELSYPDIDFLKKTYQAIANYLKIAVGSGHMASYDFDMDNFSSSYNFKLIKAYYAIKKLETEGFIQLNESFYHPSSLFLTINNKELYKFQVAHVTFDLIIKTLLRLYGGELFTGFCKISEKKIASYTNIEEQKVKQQLSSLHEQGILIYDQIKDKPQLTFLTPRFNAEKLPLNKSGIEKKRAIDKNKLQTVIKYVEQKNLCRSRFLLEYFGEITDKPCGICDICLKKKKVRQPIDTVAEQKLIIKLLDEQPLYPNELILSSKATDPEVLLQLIRQLIDTGKIGYQDDGKLALKQ